MVKITIISSSVRTGRNSDRVALFFDNYIRNNELAETEIIDLNSYNFPVFHERLSRQPNPPKELLAFADKIKTSHGVIIVTPEYNGAYPASLKNSIDLLYDEWFRKPTAIVTVSSGNFGGTQVLLALQFVLWKMKAWTVPASFPVPNVQTTFDEYGNPADVETTEKRAALFLKELFWCIEANRRMEQ